MNEKDLRDCFAMFLSVGMLMKYKELEPKMIWDMADAMIEARKQTEEIVDDEELGIAAVKPKRNFKRTT
jgi:tRNA uridine 5-carbamoylmethylation protein Kti12